MFGAKPIAAPTGRLNNLGELLAGLAGGQQPMLPPASMQSVPSQPAGPGLGQVLMGAVGPTPLPAPVPRYQSASPGAGGIAPGPIQDGQSMPSGATTKPRYSKGQIIAGIFADTMAGLAGQPGRVAQQWQRERELEGQRAYEETRWHRERQAKRADTIADDMRPRMEKVGDSLGWLDPARQKFDPIYSKPQPFEAYARQFGEPGTEEYKRAANDYILKGWGESALVSKLGLEDYRFDRRGELQGERLDTQRDIAGMRDTTSRRNTDVQAGVSRENNIRTTGTSAANNQRSTAQSNTNSVRTNATTQRGQDLRSRVRGRRIGGVPVQDSEPIAKDAQGRPMVVRNGKWVVAQ